MRVLVAVLSDYRSARRGMRDESHRLHASHPDRAVCSQPRRRRDRRLPRLPPRGKPATAGRHKASPANRQCLRREASGAVASQTGRSAPCTAGGGAGPKPAAPSDCKTCGTIEPATPPAAASTAKPAAPATSEAGGTVTGKASAAAAAAKPAAPTPPAPKPAGRLRLRGPDAGPRRAQGATQGDEGDRRVYEAHAEESGRRFAGPIP